MSKPVPLCQHIKADGIQCGSPALRRRRFCYFHNQQRERARRRLATTNRRIQLPVLEDAHSVQSATVQIIDAILENRVDDKSAKLVLYALHIAALNLRHISLTNNDSAINTVASQ